MPGKVDLSIGFVLACGLTLAVFAATEGAAAKGLNLLYAFEGGSDGAYPWAGLIRDDAGNLFGTTEGGGNSGCLYPSCGTVFELAPDDTETVLYRFQGQPDGGNPYSGLLADKAGNLYGTTEIGGTGSSCGTGGCGTVV